MTFDPRVVFHEDTFTWACPTCGWRHYGHLADEPVSGWDAPRWKLTRDADGRPTLTPSLGCRRFRTGKCTGHWWLRDGELVAA